MAIFLRSQSGAHAYWYSQLWLQNRRGILNLPNDRQQHSALKPLALVARTDSTTLQLQREAWPISAHAHWHSSQDSTRRGFCTLVLFISSVLNFVLFVLLRLRTNIFHTNNLYALGVVHVCAQETNMKIYIYARNENLAERKKNRYTVNYSCGKYLF